MIDNEGKVSIIHFIFGIILGILANYVYMAGLGMFSGIATIIFLFIGLIITGHITSAILGRNSLSQKQWLGSGVTAYFFTAIVFWIIAYNGIIVF